MSRVKHAAVLGAAVTMGGLGMYSSNNYMSNQLDEEKNRLAAEYEQEEATVVVPRRPIGKGEIVTEDLLVLRPVPAEFVHADTVRNNNYANAIGQKVAHNLDQGKPILWAQLELGSQGTFSSLIKDGRRALTITVDEVNSLSGFLQPDDKVDLLMTYKEGDLKMTRLLMSQIRVIATGTLTSPLPEGAGVRNYGTLTVDVTPKQAEKLIYAQTSGTLTATLKNAEDAIVTAERTKTTMSNLFGEKPRKKSRPKAPTKPKGIEFIIGGQVKSEGPVQ